MTRPDDLLDAAVDRRESPVLAVLSYRAARATEEARHRSCWERLGWWLAIALALLAGAIWGALGARLLGRCP